MPAPTTLRTAHPAWLRELYRGDDHRLGPHSGTTSLRIAALVAATDGVPPDAAGREYCVDLMLVDL